MENESKSKKKFYKHWWFWAIVVLVLVVIGESGGSKAPDQTAQSAAAPTTQSAPAETASVPGQTAPAPVAKQTAPAKTTATSVPAPTPTPAQAPAPHVPQVLLQVSGNGQKSTQTFTAPSSWTMEYLYDCSSFGYKGNFQVYVYNANGTLALLSGPNELGMSGSDTEYYHQGGQFYLEVNSECSWTITAKG